MHYAANIDLAFDSVEHIMRDVSNGWFVRYVHANGASVFFIVVYLHMFRGLYYGSYMYPRQHVWGSGMTIMLLMMATAFMGYVLPWGQMSLWGATVITNLFSAIPVVGASVVEVLWGGFAVDNPTLNRFFSLHYLLPFAIAAMAIVHLSLVHQHGSNTPLGTETMTSRIPFYPYLYVKDLLGFFGLLIIFAYLVHWEPNSLGHPDNYIEANPMVTPPHIVPEWYFLPYYAILRSIPDKLGGVIAMGLAIVVIALLPVVNTSELRSTAFRPLYKIGFYLFAANATILGYIGGEVVEEPFITLGQVSALCYFAFFLVFVPALGYVEGKWLGLRD
jgi:ubiquinol-cytochrome c reductase cytochrome b subunit